MKGNMTREQGLRWTSYALMVLLVLAGAYAGMLFMKVDEAESAAAASKRAADDASGSAAKAQAQIKVLSAKVAEAEQKARELDFTRALLEKLEPEVAPVLEAGSRAGKPSNRSAALATLGIIAQVVHGPKHEAALTALDRALVADKDNCAAAVALKRSGEKDLELAPDCQSLMPADAKAADAKPAAPAPAAAAPAPAAPAAAKADDKAPAKPEAKADEKKK